jgi:hypothetical protein
MIGKYSPTVSAAYRKDQKWFEKNATPHDYLFDEDGYDSYGYNIDDIDRAGITEHSYYNEYDLYRKVEMEWGYDEVNHKPLRINNTFINNQSSGMTKDDVLRLAERFKDLISYFEYDDDETPFENAMLLIEEVRDKFV